MTEAAVAQSDSNIIAVRRGWGGHRGWRGHGGRRHFGGWGGRRHFGGWGGRRYGWGHRRHHRGGFWWGVPFIAAPFLYDGYGYGYGYGYGNSCYRVCRHYHGPRYCRYHWRRYCY